MMIEIKTKTEPGLSIPEKIIIGLVGPMGSGKTTLANLLQPLGYKRLRFSEEIKRMIYFLLTDQGVDHDLAIRMLDGDLKETPTVFLENKTPRFAMQTLGTEWRNFIGKNLWVNILSRTIENSSQISFVIDDMRFPHEAEKIRNLNGRIILIERPETKKDSHASEKEFEKIIPDFVIKNDKENNPEWMLEQFLEKF